MELHGKLSPASATMHGSLSNIYKLQSKVVEPTQEEQTVVADSGFGGLSSVIVKPIPQNYGLITWDGSTLTVS